MTKEANNTVDVKSDDVSVKDTASTFSPNTFSLSDIASDLADKPITFQRKDSNTDDTYENEETAFRKVDPVLHELYRDVKNARHNYYSSIKEHGEDDPMAEILADQLDSARSAYDTRLLEIKSDKGMLVEGLSRYHDPKEEVLLYFEQEKKKKKREYDLEVEGWKAWYLRFLMLRRQQLIEHEKLSAFFITLMILFAFFQRQQQQQYATSNNLKKLQGRI